MKRLLFFCFLLFTFLLSSCGISALSATTELTLYTGENWDAKTEIVFSADQIGLLKNQIDNSIAQQVSRLKDQGIDASWSQKEGGGRLTYIISLKGQGFDKANTYVFNGQPALRSSESSDGRQVTFRYDPRSSSYLIAQQQTFILHGGRILSSNGSQTGLGSITWRNPSTIMQATLTEAAPTSWLSYLMLGVGGVLVVAVVIGLRRNMTRRQAARLYGYESTSAYTSPSPPVDVGPSVPPAPLHVTTARRYCTNYGASLPAEAGFCPDCGFHVG